MTRRKKPVLTKVQELAYELTVEEAMTRDPICVSPDSLMNDVREILRTKRISGLPVVENNRLAGIISIENFISCLIEGGIGEKVSNRMTRDVITLYSDEPLIHAINKFDRYGFGRFPVIEKGSNRLIGIITKGGIIKCLLKKLEIDYHEEEIHKYRASHIFEDIVSDKTTIIMRYRLEGGDFKSAGKQSSHLKVNLLRLGIRPQIVRRIIVAAYEAEMNVIIFAREGEIIVYIEKDKVRVNTVDKGPGIPDIEQAMQPGFSTAPNWVREMGFGAGMGLPNIKNCSDEMKIDSKVGKGTVLEFIVYLKR